MTKFVESIYVTKMREVTRESYERYWDERNGGNVSLRLTGEEVFSFEDVTEVKEVLDLSFDASPLAGYYYLVTGTGRYFRNVAGNPENDLGLVRITEDGQHAELVWGFNDGGKPTSEFPSHLMSHMERMKVNPNQRVVFHCHPTNLIALSFTQPLEDRVTYHVFSGKCRRNRLSSFLKGLGSYLT